MSLNVFFLQMQEMYIPEFNLVLASCSPCTVELRLGDGELEQGVVAI